MGNCCGGFIFIFLLPVGLIYLLMNVWNLGFWLSFGITFGIILIFFFLFSLISGDKEFAGGCGCFIGLLLLIALPYFLIKYYSLGLWSSIGISFACGFVLFIIWGLLFGGESKPMTTEEKVGFGLFSLGWTLLSYFSTPRCPQCGKVLPSSDSICPDCHPYLSAGQKVGESIVGFGKKFAEEAAKEAIKQGIDEIKKNL